MKGSSLSGPSLSDSSIKSLRVLQHEEVEALRQQLNVVTRELEKAELQNRSLADQKSLLEPFAEIAADQELQRFRLAFSLDKLKNRRKVLQLQWKEQEGRSRLLQRERQSAEQTLEGLLLQENRLVASNDLLEGQLREKEKQIEEKVRKLEGESRALKDEENSLRDQLQLAKAAACLAQDHNKNLRCRQDLESIKIVKALEQLDSLQSQYQESEQVLRETDQQLCGLKVQLASKRQGADEIQAKFGADLERMESDLRQILKLYYEVETQLERGKMERKQARKKTQEMETVRRQLVAEIDKTKEGLRQAQAWQGRQRQAIDQAQSRLNLAKGSKGEAKGAVRGGDKENLNRVNEVMRQIRARHKL